MSQDAIATDQAILEAAQAKGPLATLGAYTRLSGPGWIASAITLGGGSLASSLFLGVIGGYSLLWIQPIAMVFGVIVLSAIGYVTLSTSQRPFGAINDHINPVLGWSWALSIAAVNVVACMPQFSLATGVLEQNLLPQAMGHNGAIVRWSLGSVGMTRLEAWTAWQEAYQANIFTSDFMWAWTAYNADKLTVSAIMLVVTTMVTWSYDSSGWGLRLYELIIKIVVALIVICFFGVVVVMSLKGAIDWSQVAAGLVPRLDAFYAPPPKFVPLLDAIGQVGTPARDYWQAQIVSKQQNVLYSAAATAVGINMTLMFPYTMLRKRWNKRFRGLAIFDLSTGMFIPYILATGCIVIVSASQFHTRVPIGFEVVEKDGHVVELNVPEEGAARQRYENILAGRNADETLLQKSAGEPSLAEKRLAATLVDRDAFDLSTSLEELIGRQWARYVFGLGVMGMVLSTMSVLMLISGFVIAELLGLKQGGAAHRCGTLVAGIGGAMWPFFWQGESKFYLAIVANVMTFAVLPFAYISFLMLLNSKSLLGEERPRGIARLVWNLLMGAATLVITAGAIYLIWAKAGEAGNAYAGLAVVAAFVALIALVGINRRNTRRYAAKRPSE